MGCRPLPQCDPYPMIAKPKSIAKLLDVSPFAADLFAENRKPCGESMMISPRVRDFSYAPQRFVSAAKTLGRLVICVDAAMSTLNQVVAARGPKSDEGAASLETSGFYASDGRVGRCCHGGLLLCPGVCHP